MTLEEALEILSIDPDKWIKNCPQQEAIKKVMSVILSAVDAAERSLILEACEKNVKLEAENKMLREMVEWRDIATAPKDGTKILGFFPELKNKYSAICEMSWEKHWGLFENLWAPAETLLHGCGCCALRGQEPTHWMPLPQQPSDVLEKLK